MSEIKLKTCPFCNGNTNIRETYDIIDWVNDEPVEELRYVVECDNEECPCYANTKMYDTKEKAIMAWNTRKTVEKAVKKLEEQAEQYFLKAEKWKNKGEETENKLMNIAMTNMASCYKDAIDIVKGCETDDN